jgi:Predicted Permease Membrane Region
LPLGAPGEGPPCIRHRPLGNIRHRPLGNVDKITDSEGVADITLNPLFLNLRAGSKVVGMRSGLVILAALLSGFCRRGTAGWQAQISIAGFSLGVGAVLFVGLAIGAFAPKAQIIGPIGLTSLIMFLYGIGILYGRQFFEGMVGVGQRYNLLALVACIAGLFVALGLGHIFGIKLGHTLGLYADR